MAKANPIYVPEVYLKSFAFDQNGKWEIELNAILVDSIRMSTSTSAALFYPSHNRKDQHLSFTNDSLMSNLPININGDSITITSYWNGWQEKLDSATEIIVFGNYPNSFLPVPENGLSITDLYQETSGSNFYCICDSTGKVAGTVHGYVYDKNNNLHTSGSISLSPFFCFCGLWRRRLSCRWFRY